MTNRLPSMLIISRQEHLRDSLRILLSSLSKIGSVEGASDVSSNLAEEVSTTPALILLALDSSYADSEIHLTLRQIKFTWPSARIIVLAADESQHRVVQTAGADLILLEGISASHMLRQIDGLVQASYS